MKERPHGFFNFNDKDEMEYLVYPEMNREHVNFEEFSAFAIPLEKLIEMKKNLVFKEFGLREINVQKVIADADRIPYHDNGYCTTICNMLLVALAGIGVSIVTYMTSLAPATQQISLMPLDQTNKTEIKDLAFANATQTYHVTNPGNYTFDFVNNITFMALDIAIQLVTDQLNSTLISSQNKHSANNLTTLHIIAFAISALTFLTSFIAIYNYYNKAKETEQKQLYELQKKIVAERLPLIEKEKEFKERVITKIIDFLSAKLDAPFLYRRNLIEALEEFDDLQIYRQIDANLEKLESIESFGHSDNTAFKKIMGMLKEDHEEDRRKIEKRLVALKDKGKSEFFLFKAWQYSLIKLKPHLWQRLGNFAEKFIRAEHYLKGHHKQKIDNFKTKIDETTILMTELPPKPIADFAGLQETLIKDDAHGKKKSVSRIIGLRCILQFMSEDNFTKNDIITQNLASSFQQIEEILGKAHSEVKKDTDKKEFQISSLQTKTEKLETEKTRLKERKGYYKSEKSRLETEKEELGQANSELRNKNEQLAKQNKKLEEQIDKLSGSVTMDVPLSPKK